MPRYVVLEHFLPAGHERPRHWDLMLEIEGTLATWALDEPPKFGIEISAEQLADHRLAYLEFEGQISGDRGTVAQVDAGEYNAVSMDPGRWEIRLEGREFGGRLTLTRTAIDSLAWTAFFTAEPS